MGIKFVSLILFNFLIFFLQVSGSSSSSYSLNYDEKRERREQQQHDETNFAEWLPGHVQSEGGLFLLDRHALSEGEVLLFRTKKSRHRAIPVMSSQKQQQNFGNSQEKMISTTSRFSDALTFKDWLRRVYHNGDKALKISVRTTEVVRPVLQHLYAATRGPNRFNAPIIVHANTFQGAGVGSEKPVDIVPFLESAHQLLPESILSLGWTTSSFEKGGGDWTAFNKLDWQQAFRLLQLLRAMERREPILLNMRLNDAVHSAEVLEWLLGIDSPPIYLVLRGDVSDVVDSDSPLRRLARIGIEEKNVKKRRLLFDLDESWRNRIRRFVALSKSGGDNEEFRRQQSNKGFSSSSHWLSLQFPSSNPAAGRSSSPFLSSTAVLSPKGVAFLGWPNALLLYDFGNFVEEKEENASPKFKKQLVEGRLMFVTKRQTKQKTILPQRKSGMVIYLFDQEPEFLNSPRVPNSIQAFIGYDGRVSLENKNLNKIGLSEFYAKSSTAQLPLSNCYGFKLLDKGWRVEMEVWTEQCFLSDELNETTKFLNNEDDKRWISQRTFVQLDTPVNSNKKTS
uniref:Uncharacterized protein n=1 Tax=Meloidogyne incognita TaxID=6306 RepID=A0A914MG62_MELIC